MDWAVILREFCIHRGLLGQLVTSRYTKNVTLRWFFAVKGLFEGVGQCVWGAKMPNSCPTRHCAQTPVTQHQEKVSPNAKILNVYGTSVNIDESCAPGA